MINVDVDELLGELRTLNLTETDARRAAFCTIAVYKGWNIMQISRYMGVTRERIKQRIERLYKYTETQEVPILTELLKCAETAQYTSIPDVPISFPTDAWSDDEFSLGLLQLLVKE